ncbi:MAG: nicotinamide-nucleotide amidohydrolase family protein, partial [Moorea sp. SIO4G2]|nr:nicotinamide-nucleotide amidohydrolase family protein [Moorena sp. SIO4G2]
MLRFWGIGESALAEKVAPFFDLTNPTVAPYASKGQVRLRVSARAASENEAQQLIEPVAQKLQQIGGINYFGTDTDTLASVVGQLLTGASETLSVAESCTGGGIGSMITSVPGSSNYFLGGIIAYDNAVKTGVLGVNSSDLKAMGAESKVVAEQMATGVRSLLSSTWSLSITGIAGPGGNTDTKPVGLVYIGLAGPDGILECYKYTLGQHRSRSDLRHISACYALDRLRCKLLSR